MNKEIDVKHIKDVVVLWDEWVEHDSAAGCGHTEKTGTLYHIYESEDKRLKIGTNGRVAEITEITEHDNNYWLKEETG